MKYLLLIIFIASFSFGFITKSYIDKKQNIPFKKVTGLGGIFFKCKNPEELKLWYTQHLGLNTDQWGTSFEWRQSDHPSIPGYTQWSPFSEKSTYFEGPMMMNYRVDNLDYLIKEFTRDSVIILDTISKFDYGRVLHIRDLEGNKIELWEPKDNEYHKIASGITK